MTEVEAPPPLAPDDLDEHFAPRIRPGVVAVPIGDETVLVGELGQASVVDPLGGLVWQFLDGETAVESLVTDFAEALDADTDTVRRDLLDFVRSLGRFGLLDGVAEPVETGDVNRDHLVSPRAGTCGRRARGLHPVRPRGPGTSPSTTGEARRSSSSTGAPVAASASRSSATSPGRPRPWRPRRSSSFSSHPARPTRSGSSSPGPTSSPRHWCGPPTSIRSAASAPRRPTS